MTNLHLTRINYLAQKYNDVSMPLYLSYPVDSFWKEHIGNKELTENMQDVRSPYLYVHFPYCKSACYYCACSKYITADDELKDKYIDYIGRELDLRLPTLSSGDLNIRQMHWGGGTPTYMSLSQIDRLFNIISCKTNISIQDKSSIAIEAYPDEEMVTAEKLKLLRQLGFNTISFGIQDFDARVQKVINRNYTKELTSKLIQASKELNFAVSIDLCYGLPFQGLNEMEKTLEAIVEMNPDRVVNNPYAHFPAVFPLQRHIPAMSVPNSFMKVLLARMADEILVSNGYLRVAYDSYVRYGSRFNEDLKGDSVIRDFMGPSVESRKHVLGIGSSALSSIGNLYCRNIPVPDNYFEAIDRGILPISYNSAHLMSVDDKIRGRIILKSIMADFKIVKSKISQEFSINFEDYFDFEMEKLLTLEKEGLVENVSSDVITLTREGTYFARYIAHVFDIYYDRKAKKQSETIVLK